MLKTLPGCLFSFGGKSATVVSVYCLGKREGPARERWAREGRLQCTRSERPFRRKQGLNPEARREKPILWAITGGNQQPRAVPLVELIWEFTAPTANPSWERLVKGARRRGLATHARTLSESQRSAPLIVLPFPARVILLLGAAGPPVHPQSAVDPWRVPCMRLSCPPWAFPP